MLIQKGLGWRPQIPDHRDLKYGSVLAVTATPLPPSTNNRALIDWNYDQGKYNSCTGYSAASFVRFLLKKDKGIEFDPSKTFIYTNERIIEGDQNTDDGAYIRTAMQVLTTDGACSESDWPFADSTFFTKPSDKAYADAKQDVIKVYMAVENNLTIMKQCLAEGYPFLFGMEVFASMMTIWVAHDGIVPMPSPNEKVEGGHAVLAIDYDDSKQTITVLNSWGKDWGDRGFFHLPYAFFTDGLVDDCWTARSFV